jgi:serine/threonine-protein kinase
MDTDRNLLFGVLALQADLLDPPRFAEACSAWATRKDASLADLLVQRGWLTPADRADVEKLLNRKLKKHGGDARAGLAEATTNQVRQSLAEVADAEVLQSLSAPTPTLSDPIQASTTAYLPDARDRYTLRRLHAVGGIGRVWLAHDDALGRDVAFKELLPEQSAHPAVWARFLKEAQITGQLEHPGIVPIYEVGRRSDEQAPFYTMRFVRGRTLAQAAAAYHQKRCRSAAGPMDLRDLLTAFVGVCQAVAYAHSRGVLHRDLKPQNVVLGDFGEVIVLDWGLARLMGRAEEETAPLAVSADGAAEATTQGQVLGTPSYMAPEQAEGRLDQLGPATDVYGLGAILYEILTGRPPFTGPEKTAVLHQVIHDAPAPPRTVAVGTPAALEAVCLKALAKKAASRYATAKELAGEVQHWLADEPVSGYREPATTRLARWGRRHRSLVTSAAALLVALVLGLTAGAVMLGQANARIDRERAEAQKQRDRADASFQKAQKAVDDYLIQVSENTLLNSPLPGLQPLRKELLRTALKYYGDFVAEHQDDPTLRAQLARAHARAGKLGVMLGSEADGYSSLRQARELLEKLGQDQPERTEHRTELADVYLELSKAQIRKPEDSAERLRDLDRARELAEQLVHEDVGKNDYRALLARCHDRLARWQADNSHAAEELTSWQKAAELWNELALKDPKFRRNSASAAMNLGYYHTRLGNPACQRFFEQARVRFEELVKADPTNVELLSELRRVYTNIGYAHNLVESRPDLALLGYLKARDILQQLTRDHPAVFNYQLQKATNSNMIGGALVHLNDRTQADRFLREAQDLLEQLHKQKPDDVSVMTILSEVHVNRGRLNLLLLRKPREAVAELKQAAEWGEKSFKSNPNDVEVRTGLTRTLRDLGQAQQDSGDLPGAEQSLRRSVELNEQVGAAARSRSVVVVRQLMMAYSLLAGIAEARGNGADAARYHEQMIRVWEQELRPTNGSAAMLDLLAQAYLRRGLFLVKSGQPAAALPALREAEPVLQKLARGSSLEQYQLACARAQLSTLIGADQPEPDAAALAERQRYAERAVADLKAFLSAGGVASAASLKQDPALQPLAGRADFQALVAEREALEIAVKEKVDHTRRGRAFVLKGDHAHAVTEMEAALTSKYANRIDYYNAACIYSLASAAARKDATMSAEEQGKFGMQYADRAMELLGQAVKMGFRLRANIDLIKTSADLNTLRGRDDFKKLTADLEAALRAPAPGAKSQTSQGQ